MIVVSSTSIGDIKNIETSNREIFLGSASIWGDGNSSVLNADAENSLRIRTESTSEIVDFYIDFDMNCEGPVDEGIISLTLTLDGENLSFNLTQTPFSKNGKLYLHDVELARGDSLGFIINVVYGNVYPVYHNETSAAGIAIVNKSFLLHSYFSEHFPFITRLVSMI
jgi:hypothetical protein